MDRERLSSPPQPEAWEAMRVGTGSNCQSTVMDDQNY
jgi:hypothetical protein